MAQSFLLQGPSSKKEKETKHAIEGKRSNAPSQQVRLDAAEKVGGKVEKEARMFEPKASCRASHLAARFFGNPPQEGSVLAIAFFCLLFLARQEK